MNKHNTRSIFNLNKEKLKGTTYSTFNNVINDFNIELKKEILKGYKFKFNGFGELKIVQDVRRGQCIDWAKSKQLKQEIIKQGKIPFSKDNPNGEKWFIYFEGDYFKWLWNKPNNVKYIGNIKYYVYKTTKDNRLDLGTVVKTSKDVDLLYELYTQKS